MRKNTVTVINNMVVGILCMAIGFYAGGRMEQKKDSEKWEFYKTIIRADDDTRYMETIRNSSETIHNSSDSIGMFCLAFLEASINEKPSAYYDAYEYSDIFGLKTISLKCLQKGAEYDDPRCLVKYADLYKEIGKVDSSIVMMKRYGNKKKKDTMVYIRQKGGKMVIGKIANVKDLPPYPGLFLYIYEFEINGDIFRGRLLDDKSRAIGDTIKIFYDSISPNTNTPIM